MDNFTKEIKPIKIQIEILKLKINLNEMKMNLRTQKEGLGANQVQQKKGSVTWKIHQQKIHRLKQGN